MPVFLKSLPRNNDDKPLDAKTLPKGLQVRARLESDVSIPRLRKRKCRVIIRNLSFQATAENIATKMSKFGPLLEVNLPMVEVTEREAPDDDGDGGGGRLAAKRRAVKAEKAAVRAAAAATALAAAGGGPGGSEGGAGAGVAVSGARTRSRGYAFVTYMCEGDAQSAVESASSSDESAAKGGVKICNRYVLVNVYI